MYYQAQQKYWREYRPRHVGSVDFGGVEELESRYVEVGAVGE